VILPWRVINRDEWPVTTALCGLHFLIISAFTLAKIARDGLFLTELPASYLPYVSIGLAGVSAFAVAGFDKVSRAAPTHERLLWSFIVTGVSLVLFGFWFSVAGQTAAIPFYLWLGVYGLILVSQFWTLANERVNPRQAKRLFAVIGAAGIFGGLVAGSVVSLIGAMIKPHWLLIAAAILHGVAGLVAARSRVRPEEKVPILTTAEADAATGLSGLIRYDYVRLLIAWFLAAQITSGVLDYAFKQTLQDHVTATGAMSSVLGLFYTTQNIVALVVQLGLASPILFLLGNRMTAIILPSGILAGGLCALTLPVAGGAWVIMVTRLYDTTTRISVARTAWEFLYFPLTDAMKQRAKYYIEVVVKRMAEAAAGLLVILLHLVQGESLPQLVWVITALALIWMGLEWRLNSAYAREVSRSLGRLVRKPNSPQPKLVEVTDATEVTGLLDSQDPVQVLSALDLLETLDPAAIREQAPGLMQHPSQPVRARALAILLATGDEVDRYLPYLTAVQPAPFEDHLTPVSEAETVVDRVVTVAMAGRSTYGDLSSQRFRELFNDAEGDVRRTAYRSAGLSGDRRFLPHLIAKFSQSQERPHVREALMLYGERIVGTLGDYVVDPVTPVPVKRQLCRVIAAIGGQDAAYSMLRASDLEVDRLVMDRALQALHYICVTHPAVRLPDALILDHLREEIRRYCQRVLQQQTMQSVAHVTLKTFILQVLQERMAQSLERVFRRLALVMDHGQALFAYQGYRSGNERLRAQALEYLDTVLPSDLKRQLLPVLDASSAMEGARAAARVLGTAPLTLVDIVDELLSSREQWLKVCGLYMVGCTRFDRHLDQVQALLHVPDPMVRETAYWAQAELMKARGGDMQTVSPLSVVQKTVLLMQAEVFKDLATDEVALIAAKTQEVRFEAGQVTDMRSPESRNFYLILAGAVEYYSHDVAVGRAGQGDGVGLSGLLGIDEERITFRVVESTHALMLCPEDFEQAVADYPALALALIRSLGGALVRLAQRIEALEKA